MTLTRYEPWNRLTQLHKELDRLLDPRWSVNGAEDNSNVVTCDWIPAVDIKEEQEHFLISADIPGVEPKDIDIHMENGVLTIRGERKSESKEEGQGFKRVERIHGSFYRRFSLPDTADPEHISAKGQNGVLEIVIPKLKRTQPRKIAVES